jgi:hypothetical protein
MPTVYRTTALWTGFQGAPGYTKFSWDDLATDAARNAAGAAMRSFFFSISQHWASSWNIAVQPTVQGFDTATGTLLSEASMTTVPAVVFGSAIAAPYAGGSGVAISWKTSSIFNGRRVQGRTFLVPIIGAFETDGTLVSSTITEITTAGNALIAGSSPKFSIWAHSWDNTKDPPVMTGGDKFAVTSCVVKDMASQLRSRRT